jgi:UDP-2,4-diacetamido-2,4,6-trideoxy-beta-L-altropyranose hydrolase
MGSPSDAPPLVIRADADAKIGTGHVVRCLALAEAWQSRGGRVFFLTSCSSEPLRNRIESVGCHVTLLNARHPDPRDLLCTLAAVKGLAVEQRQSPWLTLDGYHFDTDYQAAIRSAGYKLLVIDDMAHLARYEATLILNHAITASKLKYRCDHETTLLLGTRYALLRSEFQYWQSFVHPAPEVATNILVTLGGSDAENVTERVLQAMGEIPVPDLKVRIVVGPAYLHLKQLEDALRRSSLNVRLEMNVTQMAPLMAWADLAIAAGGTTSWELAFMRVPALLLVLANNQQLVANGLAEAGIAQALGMADELTAAEIAHAAQSLMVDRPRREQMSRVGRNAVDGKGAERAAELMLEKAGVGSA